MFKVEKLYADAEWGRKIVTTDHHDLLSLDVKEMNALFNKHGVLYFEGFGTTPESFEAFVAQFPWNEFLGHGTKAKRPWVKENGETTLASLGENRVFMHPELGYTPTVADSVILYCKEKAESGGATLACDGIEVFKQMRPDVKKMLLDKKILYKSQWKKIAWSGALKTQSVAEAVVKLKTSKVVFNVEPQPDESIKFDLIVSSIIKPFSHSEPAFNSSIILAIQPDLTNSIGLYTQWFEDGSPIPTEVLRYLEDLTTKLAKPIGWSVGGIAMIENSRFLHGRSGFAGKRILHVKYGKVPARDGHFIDYPGRKELAREMNAQAKKPA